MPPSIPSIAPPPLPVGGEILPNNVSKALGEQQVVGAAPKSFGDVVRTVVAGAATSVVPVAPNPPVLPEKTHQTPPIAESTAVRWSPGPPVPSRTDGSPGLLPPVLMEVPDERSSPRQRPASSEGVPPEIVPIGAQPPPCTKESSSFSPPRGSATDHTAEAGGGVLYEVPTDPKIFDGNDRETSGAEQRNVPGFESDVLSEVELPELLKSLPKITRRGGRRHKGGGLLFFIIQTGFS